MTGRLVVISGPSGVGKDTVLRELFRIAPSMRYSVSFTTREARPGELDGVSYSFVDVPAFRRLVDDGGLLEWAEVHGNLYGTSLARVREALARGEDIVLKIDVQGAAQVREKAPDALFIFLLPPSAEVLRQRLLARGTDDPESLELRLAGAERELAEAAHYDHQVVNDDVERAAREILALVEATRDRNGDVRG